ncbi:MAG: hypothetical protein KAY65_17320 [Planctomycetes bacterium]|nr:hypothetical protein [Planctomycetota bacterium]
MIKTTKLIVWLAVAVFLLGMGSVPAGADIIFVDDDADPGRGRSKLGNCLQAPAGCPQRTLAITRR